MRVRISVSRERIVIAICSYDSIIVIVISKKAV